jgi:hypothetical protein
MKILSVPNWGATVSGRTAGLATPPSTTFTADSRQPFCGICFAPESDEGVVVVNGNTLTAGHVLPVSGSQFTITGTVPYYTVGDYTHSANHGNGVNLQLWGLESAVEVLAAADMIRAQRRLDFTGVTVATATAAAFAAAPTSFQVFGVPFIGRYRCLFQLGIADTTANNFNYAVQGQRFSPADGSQQISNITIQTAQQPDTNGNIAFYVEDETWDILVLAASFSVAPTNGAIAVRTTVSAETQQ